MKLIIAEKPSVAKTIASVVGANKKDNGCICGNGYIVTWCCGHLAAPVEPERYDPKYKRRRIEDLPIIPRHWRIDVTDEGREQFEIIKKLMNRPDVDSLICATDAGREGECIFRFVYNLAKCKKPYMRLWSSSMDDKEIMDGIENPKDPQIYDSLYKAGVARTKVDWLIGINCSRLLSGLHNADLRLGRVITYVLSLIVNRHYEILSFKSSKYYTLNLFCKNEYGEFTAKSIEIFTDKSEAESVSFECSGAKVGITNIERKEHELNPPKLYDLTTLQRDANRIYGYTAAQTSAFTQKLYEKKLCSYPRTDSKYITSSMKDTAYDLFKKIINTFSFIGNIDFNPNIMQIINDKAVSDHYAIIPYANNLSLKALSWLSDGEKNILKLLSARFICAVAEPYRYETVRVTLNCCGHDFLAVNRKDIQPGWKRIDWHIKSKIAKDMQFSDNNSDESDDISNEAMQKLTDEYLDAITCVVEHTTNPPKPYNDDTLLSAMIQAGKEYMVGDCKGIGTPATRAETIERLVKYNYIYRKGKNILPTDTGIKLIKIAPKELLDARIVAGWEMALHSIEKGNAEADELLAQTAEYITSLVEKYVDTADQSINFSDKEPVGICPRCGKEIIETPKAFSCCGGKYGSCGFTLWKEDKKRKIKLSFAKAADLLKGKKVTLSAVNAAGQKYKGEFEIVDTGTYVNLNYVPKKR